MMERRAYPSDVVDEEWALVAPYLTLMNEEAPQREHPLAAGVFEDVVHYLRRLLHVAQGKEPQPSAAILDGRTLQSTVESGSRGWDGHRRKRGSKVHLVVDTLGHLLALLVTPANEQERTQVAQLAEQIQQVTGESVQIAFAEHSIGLVVVKLPKARKASFAWTARFRRLARDYERLPETLAGLHFVAFAMLMAPILFIS